MPTKTKSTRRQLRGEELEKRIETVIRELAKQANEDGLEFVYNATRVAEKVPTTRRTLSKHDDLVERVINDLNARRRMHTGQATVEFLKDRIASLKEKLDERDKELEQLRSHHVHIYEQLHAHSVKGEALVKPILQEESSVIGHCILCGAEIGPAPERESSKIIPIRGKKNG
ncbi:hypothetical protein [Marinobacter nauticus]|uniref:Uncharacterized protein n=1 Tax=Marinobacter nauticus TaxID=2743 RepID=A0A833JR28_MARNT|nr:hypothetical protein [Marinobacter nauticus]KAE8545036.1 hypothetical protein F6453_2643 [Marinobacter nauticus]